MKNLNRITVAIDDDLFKKLKEIKERENISINKIVKNAINFYLKYKDVGYVDKIDIYFDMLLKGEHIILDIDHWLVILKLLKKYNAMKEFLEEHKKIAIAHGEQLKEKLRDAEDFFKRLETCNFFKYIKDRENVYTLVLNHEEYKEFVKILVEEVLKHMGYNIRIKEDILKLRIYLRNRKK